MLTGRWREEPSWLQQQVDCSHSAGSTLLSWQHCKFPLCILLLLNTFSKCILYLSEDKETKFRSWPKCLLTCSAASKSSWGLFALIVFVIVIVFVFVFAFVFVIVFTYQQHPKAVGGPPLLLPAFSAISPITQHILPPPWYSFLSSVRIATFHEFSLNPHLCT